MPSVPIKRQPQMRGNFKEDANGNLSFELKQPELPTLTVTFPAYLLNKYDNQEGFTGEFSFNFLTEEFVLYTLPHKASVFVPFLEVTGKRLFELMPNAGPKYSIPKADLPGAVQEKEQEEKKKEEDIQPNVDVSTGHNDVVVDDSWMERDDWFPK